MTQTKVTMPRLLAVKTVTWAARMARASRNIGNVLAEARYLDVLDTMNASVYGEALDRPVEVVLTDEQLSVLMRYGPADKFLVRERVVL